MSKLFNLSMQWLLCLLISTAIIGCSLAEPEPPPLPEENLSGATPRIIPTVRPASPTDNPLNSARVPTTATVAKEKEDVVSYLLNYFQYLQTLPGSSLTHEYQQVWRTFKTVDSPKHRLKLVLLLSFAPTSQRDDKRALDLLEGYLRNASATETTLRIYARLLKRVLVERLENEKKHQVLHNTLEQKLKQEHKERQAIEEERQLLQEKLEALTNIEKNLNDRSKLPPLEDPR